MNRIEQQETDRALKKAWDDGFSFGMGIGLVFGSAAGAAALMILQRVGIFLP